MSAPTLPHSSPRHSEPSNAPRAGARPEPSLWVYLLLGILFGIILTKGEVISWFRIQEMFRFQAWYMYGVFATAIPTAIVTVQFIKRRQLRALSGVPIEIPPKEMGSGTRYIAGGVTFGIGWAFTGACPGPLLALIGAGVPVMAAALASAIAGTWVYGLLRERLPH
ncbi:MAG: DUF6691 family protein [Gemmatimonadaceae bacterium]